MDDLSTNMFLWLIPLKHHPGPVNKTENSAKTITNALLLFLLSLSSHCWALKIFIL